MSLLSRLLVRAGQPSGVASPARPKAGLPMRRMEEEETAQPVARSPAVLARVEEEDAAQPLARQEEEEALPLARMEEEEAQSLRREEDEQEVQSLRRMDEEEDAQPLARLEEEEAQSLRRIDDEEQAQGLRRMGKEEAQPLARMEEEEAQSLRRVDEEEDAQSLRRMEEEEQDAQMVRRQSPPDAGDLTADTSPRPTEIAMVDDTPPATALRRDGVVRGPVNIAAETSDMATGLSDGLTEAGEIFVDQSTYPFEDRPTWMPPEPIVSNPAEGDALSTEPATETSNDAKVVIEQLDVIIEDPAPRAPAPVSRASTDYAAMAKRRYLGGL